MNDFISKPFQPAALFALQARWLGTPAVAERSRAGSWSTGCVIRAAMKTICTPCWPAWSPSMRR